MVKFVNQTINLDRLKTLIKLFNECEKNEIVITRTSYYLNGFSVSFEGMDGDAILHDNSKGQSLCLWETIGMPWDRDNVSVHGTCSLVRMLKACKDKEDWEQYENEV